MIKRIVEISSGPVHLSVKHSQLVIQRKDREKEDPATVSTVPIEDLGVLLVDNPAVTYTHGVFTALAESGAAVVLCGGNHHPSSLLLPIESNTVQAERYRHQLAASLPLKKRLWQSVVAAKIRQQAAVLDAIGETGSGLTALAGRVRSGDPDNLEAQAAQRYWPLLFGKQFRRRRDGPPPNNLLNYGYTVLRAAIARSVCAAGLLPTLGIHHRNRYNAFALADDLMEPFRPYVDLRVLSIVRDHKDKEPIEVSRETKPALISVLNETIELVRPGKEKLRTPLLLALHHVASSLQTSFAEKKTALALPAGLPLGMEDANVNVEREQDHAAAETSA